MSPASAVRGRGRGRRTGRAMSGRSENSTVPAGDHSLIRAMPPGWTRRARSSSIWRPADPPGSPMVASARSGSTLARTVVSALRAASSVAASVTRLAASSAVMRAAPMTSTEATTSTAGRSQGIEPLAPRVVGEAADGRAQAIEVQEAVVSRAGVGLGRNPRATMVVVGPRRWYRALEAGGTPEPCVRDGRGPVSGDARSPAGRAGTSSWCRPAGGSGTCSARPPRG